MDLEAQLVYALEEIDKLMKQRNKIYKEIIFIDTKREEAETMEEVLNGHIKEKEEYCENLEESIVSLRKEIDKINKNMKISQTPNVILNNKISPYDKNILGYIGETSYK